MCHSPGLIAAYRVLHRPAMPRHPPCALSRLVVHFKIFRFEATLSVQFQVARQGLAATKLFRILDFLPLSKSYEKLCGTALRLRARTGRPPEPALPEHGGRDRSRTCDLVLIRDAL